MRNPQSIARALASNPYATPAPRALPPAAWSAAPRGARRRKASAGFAVAAVAGLFATYAMGPFSTVVGPAEARVDSVFGTDSQSLTARGTLAVGLGDEEYRFEAAPEEQASTTAAAGWAPPAVTPDPGSAQAYAADAIAARGLPSTEFDCLVALWGKESGWRVNAYNPGSGAYGIPQALPGSKMASAGADWETSAATQIEWGLGYVTGRYGSPCAAWSHSENAGWY